MSTTLPPNPSDSSQALSDLLSESSETTTPLGPEKTTRPEKITLSPEEENVLRQQACQERIAQGLDWPVAFWIALIHVGVLAAPFFFSWQALLTTVLLSVMTGCIGITLGYHRLFTHSSFKTYKPIRWLIAFIGGLAGEGSAVHWVANHRKHHALSDQIGDPHSPLDGKWWSHVFWVLWKRTPEDYAAYNQRWAPDMAKDPVMLFLDKTFILWHLLLGGALFGAGYAMGGWYMAFSMLIYGSFLRMFYVLHITWLINSATHIWGYRNYTTTDESRNLWWVAIFSFGEGWHNNHHAYPRMARHGHKWWEFDITWCVIRTMQMLGLAWDIVDGQHLKQHRAMPAQAKTK